MRVKDMSQNALSFSLKDLLNNFEAIGNLPISELERLTFRVYWIFDSLFQSIALPHTSEDVSDDKNIQLYPVVHRHCHHPPIV